MLFQLFQTIDKGLFVFYQLSLCAFSLSHFNVPISCTLSYKQNNQLWLDLSKKQIYWKNIKVLMNSKKVGNGEEPDQLQGPQLWDLMDRHTKFPLADFSSCDFQSVCSRSHKRVEKSIIWT